MSPAKNSVSPRNFWCGHMFQRVIWISTPHFVISVYVLLLASFFLLIIRVCQRKKMKERGNKHFLDQLLNYANLLHRFMYNGAWCLAIEYQVRIATSHVTMWYMWRIKGTILFFSTFLNLRQVSNLQLWQLCVITTGNQCSLSDFKMMCTYPILEKGCVKMCCCCWYWYQTNLFWARIM